MVAETNETMRRVFESFNDGVRAMMDAGQKTQQAWAKTVTDACNRQPTGFDFDTPVARNERFAHEVGPFMGKNFETLAQACDTGFRGGMDFFQTVCDVAAHPEEGDLYQKSRRIWDKAFDAFRHNLEVASKAGTKTFENCSTFIDSVCCTEPASKPSQKTAKASQ